MFQSNISTIRQLKSESIRVNPRVNPRLSASTNKGFTLLEVIIAIFLITVGITAVLLLITKTLGAMSLSFSQLKAAYLAQEGIEVIRNIRDTNWVEGNEWKDLNKSGAVTLSEHIDCPSVFYIDPVFDAVAINVAPGQCGLAKITEAISLVTFTSGNLNDQTFYTPWPISNCTDTLDSGSSSGDAIPTPFSRYVEICYALDADNVEYMKVKSIVTWQAKGKDYEISAEEHLYNWR